MSAHDKPGNRFWHAACMCWAWGSENNGRTGPNNLAGRARRTVLQDRLGKTAKAENPMAVEEANLWRGPAGMPRILVAEDEPEMRRVLSWTLQREGYHVVEAANGTDLLACVEPYLLGRSSRVNDVPFDLIISDVRMPGVNGLKALEGIRALRACEPKTPFILITGFGDDWIRTEARRLGAFAVIEKPFTMEELLEAVKRALMECVDYSV